MTPTLVAVLAAGEFVAVVGVDVVGGKARTDIGVVVFVSVVGASPSLPSIDGVSAYRR